MQNPILAPMFDWAHPVPTVEGTVAAATHVDHSVVNSELRRQLIRLLRRLGLNAYIDPYTEPLTVRLDSPADVERVADDQETGVVEALGMYATVVTLVGAPVKFEAVS